MVSALPLDYDGKSDLRRKPHALWFIEFLRGQFRMQVFMTLWETSLLGLGGWLPGECKGVPAFAAGWIEKELAE